MFSFFDANQYESSDFFPCNTYDWIAGIDAVTVFSPSANFYTALQKDLDQMADWRFGLLGYDLKNETEKLNSSHSDHLAFPDLFFFQPRIVIHSADGNITISIYAENENFYKTPDFVFNQICNCILPAKNAPSPVIFKSRISREGYLEKVNQLLRHIHRGDIYEINFCIEFYADRVQTDPLLFFNLLQDQVPSPFSCYFRMGNKYLISASPERYLKKSGQTLISQPMKGTAARGSDATHDHKMKESLKGSEKERSENIMIVDLVRNDLSRLARRGSVTVDELAGLYTFPKVHQLISTVSCSLNNTACFSSILAKTFPMGSMTGAPKIRAMQLIEEFETTRRGAFSGSAGYIEPNGDFDFNVIIRSLLYHTGNGYLSLMAGSALTANSEPEKEYEECMLKAGYMISAVNGQLIT